MAHRVLIATLLLAAPVLPVSPNIILILVDDLGYETLGSYGGASYDTPSLDRLAESGLRFTHAYAMPLCSPSRVKLMTGRYNARNYTKWGVLPKDELTFANILQDAGYRTHVAGKWQLWGHDLVWNRGGGCCLHQGQTPGDAGFDDYLVWYLGDKGSRFADPSLSSRNDDGKTHQGRYGPDLLNDFVLEAMQSDQPFFIYYSMVLVHAPFVPTPDSDGWSGDRHAEDKAHFAAMVAYVDKMVGKTLAKLDQLGIRDETLVLLTGDNGTPGAITSVMQDGTKIRGGKGKTIDHGSHVPFIASWPGVIEPGVSNALVDFTDVLPTLADAADAKLPSDRIFDGHSLLPVFRGEAEHEREWIFTDYRAQFPNITERRYVHNRRYKLYDDGRFFDWENDILEQNPLADAEITAEAAAIRESFRDALNLRRVTNGHPASAALPELGEDFVVVDRLAD